MEIKVNYFERTKNQSKVCYLQFFPPELILETFNFLEGYDLLHARAVCKLFFDIITEYMIINVHTTIKGTELNVKYQTRKIYIEIIRCYIDYDHKFLLNKIANLKNLASFECPDYGYYRKLYSNFYQDKIVCRMPHLEILDAHCSAQITDASISCLKNLVTLKVSYGSKISNEEIAKLTKLRELVIRNCENIKFDKIVTLTQLEKLVIAGYDTPKINDDQLSNFINLKELLLSRQFSVTNSSVIKLTNLTKLSIIERSNITSESLIELKNLRELRLTCCNIGNLNQLKQIKILKLGMSSYTSKTCKELVQLEKLEVYQINVRHTDFINLKNLKLLLFSQYNHSCCSNETIDKIEKMLPGLKVDVN